MLAWYRQNPIEIFPLILLIPSLTPKMFHTLAIVMWQRQILEPLIKTSHA